MNIEEQNEAAKIREEYTEREETKFDRLKALDKSVRRPAAVFSYAFGSVGALVLGGGMCLAIPEVTKGFMPLGIAVGLVGILMISVNYILYNKILKKRKARYADEIIELSNEILCEQ